MDVGGWIGIIGGCLSGLGVLIMGVMNTRAKNKADSQDQKFQEREKTLDRYEKQLARQDLLMAQKDEAFTTVTKAHIECCEERAAQEARLDMFHDLLIRFASEIKRLNGNPGEIPPLPTRRQNSLDSSATHFIQNTLLNSASLVSSLDPRPSKVTSTDTNAHS